MTPLVAQREGPAPSLSALPASTRFARLNSATSLPELSIVVPTRNEAGNVDELVRRLEQAMLGTPVEAIFVDDSDDETPEIVAQLAQTAALALVLLHRPPSERIGGLGGAVVEGIRVARAPWVCVMDADLQHPPEVVPRLLARTREADVDAVVASRYRPGGGAPTFGRFRAALSQASTFAAHLIARGSLRSVTDPMSGFFLVRRADVDPDCLHPQGFKILLEILVRTPQLRVAEEPFEFGVRQAGESKASLGEGVRYLQLLLDLSVGERWRRFTRFGLVGISGVVVNFAILVAATEFLHLFYLVSAVLAAEASTAWNFALTERWVFAARAESNRARRAASFFLMNNLALVLTAPCLYVLTTDLRLPYVVSNAIVIAIMMLLRFLTADRLIWKTPADPQVAAA